jgi:SAM-dependent methyltransferase
MALEKRMTFNEVAELYDKIRPQYPPALFSDLIELSGVEPKGRILEIGAGTGIATLPLAERGYEIVAIEPGADLAAVARRKLSGFSNVTIAIDSFEDWTLPPEPFDLVLSATAFHWVDPVVRYEKAARALRADGALAVFGYHHVAGGDEAFFEQVQDCYRRNMPGTNPDERLQDPGEFVVLDTKLLEASGFFQRPENRTYLTEAAYTKEEYLDLLSTYSGHRVLDPQNRQALLDCIGSLIDKGFNGRIRKQYLTDLVVAHVQTR